MNRFTFFLVALVLLTGLTACQDTYEDLFLNPEQSTDAKIPYLFTEAVVAPEFEFGYWEGYYRFYRNINRWAQLTGTVNEEQMMQPNDARWADYWRDYYTRWSMLVREMNDIYETLPDDEKAQNEVYLILGDVIHAYTTANLTDLWGDMPYSEAFTARESADERNLFPAYDTQEAIYDDVLAKLKTAADRLRSGDFTVPANLARQDVLFGGDLDAWQRLTNSLRLRLGMRLSEVAPSKAQAVVNDVLTGGYLLVEDNAENLFLQTTDEHNSFNSRGIATRESIDQTYAGEVMLSKMLAADDPRIPVYFDPSWEGAYVGLPSSPDDQPGNISRATIAYVDSLLFDQNYDYPGYIVTAAEVSFLKAEAAMRGWGPGDAGTYYDQALRQSVEFWYELYNMNTLAPDMEMPDAAAIDAFLEDEDVAWNGTLERLATQKWIHFYIDQPYEAWAELRRTGYPQLPDDRMGGRVLQRTVRITYPSTELTNNRASYEAVADKDQTTTRVWWDVQ